MKTFRWQLLIVMVTGLVVGLLLLFQQNSTTLIAESTPSPISGGIYTEALVGSFLRLNPILDRYNQADQDVDRLIFNSLIKFDTAGRPQPDLADSWSYSSDATRYTFSLRPNIYWHDGTPVTTQDVIYTISLMQSGNALIPEDLRTFWSEIVVTAISDTMMEFALPEAFAPFLDYLSFRILPAHLLGNLTLDALVDHPFNMAPIGTGPYKFNRFLTESGVINGVVLEANENYYDGKPYIDEVVFQYYATESEAWTAFQAGEIDGISSVSNSILPQVLAEPGLNLYSSTQPRLCMVFLNLNKPAKGFLQNANVRKALMLAINRQNIIDQAMLGQGILANGPIIPSNWAYYQDLGQFGYDPDAARQLLAAEGIVQGDAGYLVTADGIDLLLVLVVQDDALHMQIGQFIKQDWEAIGVAVDILPTPYDQVMVDLSMRNFDAALMEIDFSGTPDPDPYPFWSQSQAVTGQNYSQWDHRSASEYLEQARVTNDQELRIKLYRNFQIVFQDELPSLPLFYPVYNYAVKDTVKDVSIGPIYDASDRLDLINTWYILTGKTVGESTPAPENSQP